MRPSSPRRSPRQRTRITALIAAVLVAAAALVASPAQAAPQEIATTAGPVVKMADLSKFQPGNIIADTVFYDSKTMTAAQIQTFLNSKVSRCLGGIDEDGIPIVCIKDLKIKTQNRSADSFCKGYTGRASETAAEIIANVSVSCGINPQTLLVMLQKEQGLITHSWPSNWRYEKAMGQACPDTAPCDKSFAGFFNQMYGGARQMQIYAKDSYFSWYPVGKTTNVLYNPNYGCGSSPVSIQNSATASLYYYTPYQPNAAALRAGYGEGDGCSAYGNRNFFNYFTDWFGSTQKPTTPPVTYPPAPPIASYDKDNYIVAADASGTVFAYPYKNGGWGTRKQLAKLAGITQIIGVGDLSGNGHRDFILRTSTAAFLIVGDGKGNFAAPKKLAVNWTGAVQVTAAGDFNGDGVPDVFTTDKAGNLLLWPGNKKGDFGPSVGVGVGWQGMNVIFGGLDVNGNGVPDLYARSAAGDLYLYGGLKGSKWAARTLAADAFSGIRLPVEVGDVSGDGRPDVMGIDATGVVNLFVGDAQGSLKAGPRSGQGWGGMVSLSGAGPQASGKTPPVVLPSVGSPGAGDVDGDGAMDVLGLTSAGVLRLYSGTGSGAWRTSSTASTGWQPTDRLVTVGDFNGDGLSDVARVGTDGKLWLYPGTGKGTYGAGKVIGTGWAGMTAYVGGIDFDGDGNVDLLARAANGNLVLYRGNGRGGWIAPYPVVGSGWNVATKLWNAGDIDGDGHADVLMTRSDGSLWLYPTTGARGWKTPRQVGRSGWNAMTAVISPGDFNGDGKPDMLARDTAGLLWLYPGGGNGSWGPRVQVGSGWQDFVQIG